MSITELVESPAYKKTMGYVYGWGAAVAIIGALFKIMHYPGAGVMLVAGLGVEALIFFMSAFEPPHAMPDWTLVYPELLGLDEEEGEASSKAASHVKGGNGGNGGGSELSALVSSGAITQQTIDQLGAGVKKLAETTSQMSDIADASVATKAYINNVKVASDSLNQFTTVQTQASEIGAKLTSSSAKLTESISSQADLSQKMVNSMSAVSEAYDQQVAGLQGQLDSTKKLAEGLSVISSEIQQSVQSVQQYREQIASLSKTVSELNNIYGNMLSAITNR